MIRKFSIFFWVVSIISLFLYSFTQVDLGLTLSRTSIITSIQKSFQYIGYFNRPLSSLFFIVIIIALFTGYGFLLKMSQQKKVSRKTLWVLIIFSSILLGLSYNAFSYDFFNYIFDAKIFTHYHQSPYDHKALDYPGDPMLGFMHWTHRLYPYGPVWLGLTIPLSFLGGGIFAITLLLFKTFSTAMFLVSCFFIEKISSKLKLNSLFTLAFFALNPFVLIESVVSAHNDSTMMALTVVGVYFLFNQKKYSPWIMLALSAGIKFATGFLAPVFMWFQFSKRKNKEEVFFYLSVALMIVAAILASFRTTFQPWYFLLVFPFLTFLTRKYFIFISTFIFSFLVLFQYLPYLYTGNFNPPIPDIMSKMLWVTILISVFSSAVYKLFRK